MNVKSRNTKKTSLEEDDAPELNEEWFKTAHIYDGERLIRRGVGRPPMENKKEMLSLRVDPGLLEKLRSSGKGWQTRLSAFIQESVTKGTFSIADTHFEEDSSLKIRRKKPG
jgi:uncharacterized protein (DUF4415 family)